MNAEVMHTQYERARGVFGRLRSILAADDVLRQEFEAALDMLRTSYDAAIYENRFIVGGAIEHLAVALFNGAGLPAQHVGRGDMRVDMTVRDPQDGAHAGFSIKASFSSRSVRLINVLGNGSPKWTEPTLFLFTGIGMVYADYELLPDATKRHNDALVLEGGKVTAYVAANREQIIALRIEQPSQGNIRSSKTASEDVARSIIRNFTRLSLP